MRKLITVDGTAGDDRRPAAIAQGGTGEDIPAVKSQPTPPRPSATASPCRRVPSERTSAIPTIPWQGNAAHR